MAEESVIRDMITEGLGYVSGAILVTASLAEMNTCFAASGKTKLRLAPVAGL